MIEGRQLHFRHPLLFYLSAGRFFKTPSDMTKPMAQLHWHQTPKLFGFDQTCHIRHNHLTNEACH
jgi:hypothetical protein